MAALRTQPNERSGANGGGAGGGGLAVDERRHARLPLKELFADAFALALTLSTHGAHGSPQVLLRGLMRAGAHGGVALFLPEGVGLGAGCPGTLRRGDGHLVR